MYCREGRTNGVLCDLPYCLGTHYSYCALVCQRHSTDIAAFLPFPSHSMKFSAIIPVVPDNARDEYTIRLPMKLLYCLVVVNALIVAVHAFGWATQTRLWSKYCTSRREDCPRWQRLPVAWQWTLPIWLLMQSISQCFAPLLSRPNHIVISRYACLSPVLAVTRAKMSANMNYLLEQQSKISLLRSVDDS